MMSVQTVCKTIVTEVGDEICVPITEIESRFQDPQVYEPPLSENKHLPIVRIDNDAMMAALRIKESARAFVETTRPIFTR